MPSCDATISTEMKIHSSARLIGAELLPDQGQQGRIGEFVEEAARANTRSRRLRSSASGPVGPRCSSSSGCKPRARRRSTLPYGMVIATIAARAASTGPGGRHRGWRTARR